MNKHIIAEIVLSAVIFVFVVLATAEYFKQHERIAVAKAQSATIEAAQADKDAALKARDKQHEQDMAALQDQYKKLEKSKPKEVVKTITELLPAGNRPVVLWEPGVTAPQSGDAIVPQEDLKPIAKIGLDLQQCNLDYSKCLKDTQDWKDKYQLAKKDSQNWENAAKGGTFWVRLRNDAIKIGIGFGAGYLVAKH